MTISSDDLADLRSKLSDDQVIEGLSKTNPQDESDISELKASGLNNTQILDGFAKHSAATAPSTPGIIGKAIDLGSKTIKALQYGVSDEAKRLGTTSKVLSGDNQSMLSSAGQALNDPTYDPASNHVGLSADGLSYLPRAVVESLPSQGGYLGAGAAGGLVGGPVGALLGAGAYGLTRYLGTNAQQRAANNGHADQVTNQDIAEALPGTAGQAALDAVGSRFLAGNALLKAAPVTGAGLDAMKQTAGNIVKTGVVNAATTGANDAVGQAGTEIGTQAGYHPDLAQSEHAALVGGLVGAGLKTVGSVPEGIMNIRQTNTDPTIRNSLADDLNGTRISGDPSNPDDTGKILKNAKAVIGNDANEALGNLKSSAKQTEAQGQDASHLNAAADYANTLLTNLRTGKLDPDQVTQAKQTLVGQPDLLNSILKLNEIHNLADQSNTKGVDDMSPNAAFDALHLMHYGRKGMAIGSLGAAAAGHAALGIGLYGLPLLGALGSRIKSSISGDRDFVNQYAQRFGGQGDPSGMPGVPPQEQPQQPQSPQEQPSPQQQEPQAPQRGPITDPRLLLNRPPIYAPGHTLPQGVDPAHYAEVPEQAPAPEQPAPAAPQQQLRLPAPPIYAGAPKRGFSDQPGADLPTNLLMLRAAMQKAAGQQSPEDAGGQPPTAPQSPVDVPVAPRARGKVQEATVAPKEAPQTFNQQADHIEQAIKAAQATVADPKSSPDEVAAAKASLRKSALAAAAQHDASKGGGKGPKKAIAAHSGGSGGEGHAKAGHAGHTGGGSGNAHGAHAAPHAASAAHASAHAGAAPSVDNGVFNVETKHGTVTLHNTSTRRNPEVQAAGIIKRVNARDEVGQAVSNLPLSPQGHAAAAAKVPELMQSVLHLSNASEARDHLNRFLGSFSAKDHATLGQHFNNFKSSSGMSFLGTWKHGDEAMARAATVKNEAINKGKQTRAANRAAKDQ